MFTHSHANTPLGQSERTYYLGYFISYDNMTVKLWKVWTQESFHKKVEYDRPAGRIYSWVGLLFTVTGVLTTCAAVIFRDKVVIDLRSYTLNCLDTRIRSGNTELRGYADTQMWHIATEYQLRVKYLKWPRNIMQNSTKFPRKASHKYNKHRPLNHWTETSTERDSNIPVVVLYKIQRNVK